MSGFLFACLLFASTFLFRWSRSNFRSRSLYFLIEPFHFFSPCLYSLIRKIIIFILYHNRNGMMLIIKVHSLTVHFTWRLYICSCTFIQIKQSKNRHTFRSFFYFRTLLTFLFLNLFLIHIGINGRIHILLPPFPQTHSLQFSTCPFKTFIKPVSLRTGQNSNISVFGSFLKNSLCIFINLCHRLISSQSIAYSLNRKLNRFFYFFCYSIHHFRSITVTDIFFQLLDFMKLGRFKMNITFYPYTSYFNFLNLMKRSISKFPSISHCGQCKQVSCFLIRFKHITSICTKWHKISYISDLITNQSAIRFIQGRNLISNLLWHIGKSLFSFHFTLKFLLIVIISIEQSF